MPLCSGRRGTGFVTGGTKFFPAWTIGARFGFGIDADQKALFGLVSVELSASVRRNKETRSVRRTLELEQSRAKAG
jgi:hypothetical protein